jgi:hypothetical protein
MKRLSALSRVVFLCPLRSCPELILMQPCFLIVWEGIFYVPLPYILYLIDSCAFPNLIDFSCERA